MKKVGLTGGIGVGKTYISKIFERIGLPVFNADLEAKRCIVDDKALILEIEKNFGSHIYDNGALRKKDLADIVFNNFEALQKLNSLVHPVVKKRFEDWCLSQGSNIVIKEAAIIFETDAHLSLDYIVCVSAYKDLRINRVQKRDGYSAEDVIKRMEMQIPQSKKEELSDFVIVNNEKDLLLPQILNVLKEIG
mgnify:CR=1 FL=1